MTARTGWLLFRVLRLAAWLGALGYYAAFALNQAPYHDSFGRLLTRTEYWMFGLPLAAIFLGFMEMMMRNRAGLPRPALFRDWTA